MTRSHITSLRGRSRPSVSNWTDCLLRSAGREPLSVLRGEAGIGKTALLEYLVESAADLPSSGRPGSSRRWSWRTPACISCARRCSTGSSGCRRPSATRSRSSFGLQRGAAPDRFLVGLAALSLLSEAAEERPLLCVVDDAQWLDQASALTLAFVARRLLAEPVGLVFAAREPGERASAGCRELEVDGLRDGDAQALLSSAVRVALDARVRDRIIAETRGNPLALLELPRGLTPDAAGRRIRDARRPGRLADGSSRASSGGSTRSARRRAAPAARRGGRAGRRSRCSCGAHARGSGSRSAAVDATDGLLAIDERVTVPASAGALGRLPVGRRAGAPGGASGAGRGDDRESIPTVAPGTWRRPRRARRGGRARAGALGGPGAGAWRPCGRGGVPAARGRADRRSRAAGRASARRRPGQPAAGRVRRGSGFWRPRRPARSTSSGAPAWICCRLRSRSPQNRGSDAPLLLLERGASLESLDAAPLARHVPRRVGGSAVRRQARDARAAACSTSPAPSRPRPRRTVLRVRATCCWTGSRWSSPRAPRRGARRCERAVARVRGRRGLGGGDAPLGLAGVARGAPDLGLRRCLAIATRAARARPRRAGRSRSWPLADNACGQAAAFGGDFATAALPIAEVDAVKEATGTRIGPYAAIALAGLRGQEAEASELIDARRSRTPPRGGQGTAVQYAHWANAVLMNGLGRYEEALAAAAEASEDTPELFIASWALSELIEAATRTRNAELARGCPRAARRAHARRATPIGRSGIHARSRALLSDGDAAEACTASPSIAWRAPRSVPSSPAPISCTASGCAERDRRVDAREQLRAAHELFVVDGHGGVRRARRAGAAGDRRDGAQAHGRDPRRADRSGGADRSARRAMGCRTRRSARGCSSARARSSGTCARSSPSSRSTPAESSRLRCPAPGLSWWKPEARDQAGVSRARRPGKTSTVSWRHTATRKEILMSPSTGPLPTPEGPGSVSGAPNLPAGFTDTFTSRYVDTGDAAPARGRSEARAAAAAGPRLARDLVRLAPADAGAGPGLRGHRGRPARHRAVRQARGRVRHRHPRRRPGRADGRARPRAVRGGRPRHRIRDQLRAGRRPPGPGRPRGPRRDPRPARRVLRSPPVFVPAPLNDRLWHIPFNRVEKLPEQLIAGTRGRLLRLRVRHPGRQAARRGGRLLRRAPAPTPTSCPAASGSTGRSTPPSRRTSSARAGRCRCPSWRSAERRATASTSGRR